MLQVEAGLKNGSSLENAAQVLYSASPAVHVVVTPNWWLNWFGPTFFPRHLVDKEVCRRFRLTR